MSTRIGFVGCGKMAQALAKGWLEAGIAQTGDLAGSEIAEEPARSMGDLGVTLYGSNAELARVADVIVLAVKPQAMDGVLHELKASLTDRHLVVSIAAGVTLARLESGLGGSRRVIRVMPNTPCLVGAAASGLAAGTEVKPGDVELVERLFGAVGVAYRVSEPLLDAVTGLSGSGPAFIYQVIEALSDGGVLAGLPRDVATALAAQTTLGAAKMVLETGRHPGELKDMVTSPAGTTIAGLAVLEERGVRGAFMEAVRQASQRARELGKPKS